MDFGQAMQFDLTDDGFLDGRLRILQPKAGYRAATDPVLLAAFAPAEPGQSVLELGCGAGVASLCLGYRVKGLALTGVERQSSYAYLARKNADRNAAVLHVVEADLAALPPTISAESFDHALANPPYFRAGGGTAANDVGKEGAFREQTPLSQWIDTSLRRLRPGGWLTMIHLAERLDDILADLRGRTGSVEILPVAPRSGRPATRVLVRARKVDRGPLTLLPPLVLHDGAEHLRDGDDYSMAARSVLRDGAALPIR
jgi:tRNA1Val (adenine37-N6)-methyltransferase